MRHILFICAVFLALAPAAGARTTIDGPGQATVDRALVPTPDAAVSVTNDPVKCPGLAACTYPQENAIYGRFSGAGGTVMLYHELGHIFDYRYLSDVERQRFLDLLGLKGDEWGWDWNAYSYYGPDFYAFEVFADTYAACATNRAYPGRLRFQPASLHAPDLLVSGRRMRQLCTFIVRSYWR